MHSCDRSPSRGPRAQAWLAKARSSLTALLLVGAALAGAAPASASGATPYAVSATIQVGYWPHGAAVNPNTDTVYVANELSGTVSVINGATDQVEATISVGSFSYPHGVAVDPSTDTVYVANYNGDSVSVINGATNTVVATIPLGPNPFGVAVDPSTDTVYVTGVSQKVWVIDGSTNTLSTTIPVAYSAYGVAIDPSTGTVYVAGGLGVTVINESSNTVTGTITTGYDTPYGVAVDSSTDTVYVADHGYDKVSVINGASDAVTAVVPVAGTPWALAVDPSTGAVYVADYGDGTVSVINGATNTVTATLPVGGSPFGVGVDPSTHTAYVTNTVADNVSSAQQASDHVSVITANTPPTVASGGPYAGAEGSAISLNGTAADSDGDTVTTRWTAAANSGTDGTCTFLDASVLNTSVTCTDQGSYTLTLTASEGVNPAVRRTAQLTVGNAPIRVGAITGLPTGPVAINTSVNAAAAFTDPGTADGHTATFDWGDGTASPGTVTETAGSGTGSVAGSHTYAAPGVYTVTAAVYDGDSPAGIGSSSYQYVVVYDPAAGFVTGGGTIDSPAGAFPAEPTLTGTAHFGFVSKYKVGSNTPVGQTQFQFRAGSLDFHSSSYDAGSLVISGPLARYAGTGTVKGSKDSYAFLVEAYDCNVTGSCATSPDGFRIQITDTTTHTLVYDNVPGGSGALSQANTEPIATGGITIHK